MIFKDYTTTITYMQQYNKNNQIILGQRIKKLREKQEISLNKFVNSKGGLTTATWSRIENGIVNCKLSTLIFVASMLNVSVSKLFEGIEFDYSIIED